MRDSLQPRGKLTKVIMDGSETQVTAPVIHPPNVEALQHCNTSESDEISSELAQSLEMNALEALGELNEDGEKADFKLPWGSEEGVLVTPWMKDEEAWIHPKTALKTSRSSNNFLELEELRSQLKKYEEPFNLKENNINKSQVAFDSVESCSMTDLSRKEFQECVFPALWPETAFSLEQELMEREVLSRDEAIVQEPTDICNKDKLLNVADPKTDGIPDLGELPDFKEFAEFYNKSGDDGSRSPRKVRRPPTHVATVKRSYQKA